MQLSSSSSLFVLPWIPASLAIVLTINKDIFIFADYSFFEPELGTVQFAHSSYNQCKILL